MEKIKDVGVLKERRDMHVHTQTGQAGQKDVQPHPRDACWRPRNACHAPSPMVQGTTSHPTRIPQKPANPTQSRTPVLHM